MTSPAAFRPQIAHIDPVYSLTIRRARVVVMREVLNRLRHEHADPSFLNFDEELQLPEPGS